MKHTTQPNDPANPITDTYLGDGNVPIKRTLSTGLTKREMIAMHLLSGMMSNHSLNPKEMAEEAVQYADALINYLNETAK